MRKILSLLFAMVVTLPALAMDVNVTVLDENGAPLVGAALIEKDTTNGASTDLDGRATLHVPDNALIEISFVGYETETRNAKPTLNIQMEVLPQGMDDVVITAECTAKPAKGIKTQKKVDGKCVPDTCYPCYTLIDDKCELNTIQGGEWSLKADKDKNFDNLTDYSNATCVLTCNESQGYKKSPDGKSCTRDCLDTVKSDVPLATKAEYDSNNVCKIQDCDEKDGKKYIPSDDGVSCEVTERDCDKTKDAAIWPEHATAASYTKSKPDKPATCYATECENGYKPDGGTCISVNGSDCDKQPENSTKSRRYYDKSKQQTLCLVDECKKGYKPSNDKLSCILESALSEEDAKERMKQLKENEQKMKEREQSAENKLLGAAGIGAVGIGGMNIASALAEKNADRDTEQEMKAYLATFRCDYGQGRNILGGEKGIQLPAAPELIQYTTEYKQIAANLKADKAALGMMPGIESQVVFDSATTGLYDDVSIGRQKGAFTSLSRALLDENSADAAEWRAMKDKTAQKLKTGLITAGVGAAASLAGNIVVNHGKGDKSASILDMFEKKKKPIPDMTPERIPCSKYEGTKDNGEFAPNCDCQNDKAYFDKENKCTPCGRNQHVENNECKCDEGYVDNDIDGNCEEKTQQPQCSDFTGNAYVSGGEYPTCNCEYQGATFDKTMNTCMCPSGQVEDENSKKCIDIKELLSLVTPSSTPAPDDTPAGPDQPTVSVFEGSFPATNTFDIGSDKISDEKCAELANLIKQNENYNKNKDLSGTLYICATGHTDTSWYGPNSGVPQTKPANFEANKGLSERRAKAVDNCLKSKISVLFQNARYKESNTRGVSWSECYEPENSTTPAKDKQDIGYCRRVEVIIQTTPCEYN